MVFIRIFLNTTQSHNNTERQQRKRANKRNKKCGVQAQHPAP